MERSDNGVRRSVNRSVNRPVNRSVNSSVNSSNHLNVEVDMPEKLIDGNITIEDKASASLSQIESALRGIGKMATPVTKKMQALNKEIAKMKSAPMDDGGIYGRVNQKLSHQKWFKDLPQTQKVQIIRDTVNKTQRQNAAKSSLAMKSMFETMDFMADRKSVV